MKQFIKYLEKIVMRRRVREEAEFAVWREEQQREYESLKRQIDEHYTRAEAKRPKPRPPVPNGSSH